MNRLLLIALFSFGNVALSFAQSDQSIIKAGDFEAIVLANGSCFANKKAEIYNGFSQNLNNHFFRYSAPWMVGVLPDTVRAKISIKATQPQFWPGPIDTLNGEPKDAINWAKTWPISREIVNYHRKHYTEAEYILSDEIKNWPAKHNETNVSAYLAPFIDWNVNGVYDPENGDYPSFIGDQAVYFIANDLYGENLLPNSQKLGVEIQGLIYTYNDPILQNVLFNTYYVINRSSDNYSPFYFGQFLDFELGNSTDNYVATDVNRNLFYGFNGDENDENFFNNNLPQGGVMFLDKELHSSTILIETDSVRGFPQNEKQVYNLAEGMWFNGLSKLNSGNGVSEGSNTRYIYTDEKFSDAHSLDNPGERKGVAFVKFDRLKSHDFVKIEFAFIVGADSISGLEKFLVKSDDVREFFNNKLTVDHFEDNIEVGVYPNPLNLNLVNTLYINALSVDLYDCMGHYIVTLEQVNSAENEFKVPCNESFSSGIYYLNITRKGEKKAWQKLVIVKD
ncbi:MAG: T9SS type A sorting domain-containing protein [Flavobacteriales bacterium]|nr:T9SS type A sorting domain-containing protein [Flavobacteriales bacterium]